MLLHVIDAPNVDFSYCPIDTSELGTVFDEFYSFLGKKKEVGNMP